MGFVLFLVSQRALLARRSVLFSVPLVADPFLRASFPSPRNGRTAIAESALLRGDVRSVCFSVMFLFVGRLRWVSFALIIRIGRFVVVDHLVHVLRVSDHVVDLL